jgi:hypothetical protein
MLSVWEEGIRIIPKFGLTPALIGSCGVTGTWYGTGTGTWTICGCWGGGGGGWIASWGWAGRRAAIWFCSALVWFAAIANFSVFFSFQNGAEKKERPISKMILWICSLVWLCIWIFCSIKQILSDKSSSETPIVEGTAAYCDCGSNCCGGCCGAGCWTGACCTTGWGSWIGAGCSTRELHIFGGESDKYKVLFCLTNQNYEIIKNSIINFQNNSQDCAIGQLFFERTSGTTQRRTKRRSRGSFNRKWPKR